MSGIQQSEALRLAHTLSGGKLIDDSTEQPEALRLVEWIESDMSCDGDAEIVAELRRQHARIEELEEQLSTIGAGGVEPLRKQAEDGWIQDGHLLYRLTDGHRPRNRDEINVTMANSSRTEEARTRRASELLHAIRAAAAPAVPQGWKLVQIELLERIQESLGSFLSDQGWSQSDMDTADALGGLLAAAPQPPACNQSMQPELATYSAQTRNKKGIEQ